jgi:hypothetical protein
MEHREIMEIKKITRRHEEFIHCNMTSMFLVTTKVHTNKHLCVTQHTTLMKLLANQKHRMDTLKAECNMLINRVLNPHKYALFIASNNKTFANSTHVEVQ